MYILWSGGIDLLESAARSEISDRLADHGAHHIQINVTDAAVADAAPLRIASSDRTPTGLVSMWLDSALEVRRADVDAVLTNDVSSPAGYLVTESVPLLNTAHPPTPGERTFGFAQIACLPRPPRLEHETWRAIWQDDHTQLAIDTQSTFGYVQNLVVRPLTADAPPYAAIVEELFPPAAMTSPHAFFDALDGDGANDDRLQRNVAAMIESTVRFLDVDQIDVFPTSQYVVD